MLRTIKLILALLLLNPLFCAAQGVRFQFYRIDPCSGKEKLYSFYFLRSKMPGDNAHEYLPQVLNKTAYLPGPGKYGLWLTADQDTVIDIRDTGLFVFRYRYPELYLQETGAVDMPPAYFKCDTLAEGYQEGHYADGRIMIRGNFIDGYAKDSVVSYYENGRVKKEKRVYHDYTITKEFDSSGHLLKFRKRQNKAIIEYAEYEYNEFYPTGKPKVEWSSVRRIERIKQFYPNGQTKIIQTKRYRTEYYENGMERIAYTWKRKKDIAGGKFVVMQTDHNESGVVTEKAEYEYWYDNPITQPRLGIKNADWINSFEKFDAGKKVLSVTDMDTNDFLKQYPDEADEDGA